LLGRVVHRRRHSNRTPGLAVKLPSSTQNVGFDFGFIVDERELSHSFSLSLSGISSFFFLCFSRWKQRKSVARSIFTSAAPVTPPPVRAWCLCVRQTRSCREFYAMFCVLCSHTFLSFLSKIVEILFLSKRLHSHFLYVTSLTKDASRPPSPLSLSYTDTRTRTRIWARELKR